MAPGDPGFMAALLVALVGDSLIRRHQRKLRGGNETRAKPVTARAGGGVIPSGDAAVQWEFAAARA